jgi:hypothetical protein
MIALWVVTNLGASLGNTVCPIDKTECLNRGPTTLNENGPVTAGMEQTRAESWRNYALILDS